MRACKIHEPDVCVQDIQWIGVYMMVIEKVDRYLVMMVDAKGDGIHVWTIWKDDIKQA
jgi:hypothetical protein